MRGRVFFLYVLFCLYGVTFGYAIKAVGKASRLLIFILQASFYRKI